MTALAASHTTALTCANASNQRFLVVNGVYDMQELADIIHSSPEISETVRKRVPIGEPGTKLRDKHYKVNGSKAVETLKLEEPSLRITVLSLLQQILKMEADDNV